MKDLRNHKRVTYSGLMLSGKLKEQIEEVDRQAEELFSHLVEEFLEGNKEYKNLLRDPMDCSTPGFPVHHQHPKLAQIHVHQVSDAIQPPHPLSSPSPPAFNLSQHQDLY